LETKTLEELAVEVENIWKLRVGDSNTAELSYIKFWAYNLFETGYSAGASNDISTTVLKYHGVIDQMFIKAYSSVKMTIQNITEADDGTSGEPLDKHRVDANPLYGKMYRFSDSLPKIRGHSYRVLVGAGEFTANEYLLARDQNRDGIIFPQEDLEGAFRHLVIYAYTSHRQQLFNHHKLLVLLYNEMRDMCWFWMMSPNSSSSSSPVVYTMRAFLVATSTSCNGIPGRDKAKSIPKQEEVFAARPRESQTCYLNRTLAATSHQTSS